MLTAEARVHLDSMVLLHGIKGKKATEKKRQSKVIKALMVAAANKPQVAVHDLKRLSSSCPSCFVQLRKVMDNGSIVK